MRIISKLWYFLLVALVSQPVILLAALLITVLELHLKASEITIIGSIIGIALLTPVLLLIIFLVFYFKVTNHCLIRFDLGDAENGEEVRHFEFYFKRRVEVKNVLKIFWWNLQEIHASGYSYFAGFEYAKMKMIECDLRPYLARNIKIKYGIDAHDAFIRTSYNKIDIELY